MDAEFIALTIVLALSSWGALRLLARLLKQPSAASAVRTPRSPSEQA